MKAVGVKELKARLSEYLREVRRGETLLVTDRGQVIAEVRPAPPGLSRPADDLMETLIESGEVSRAAVRGDNWTWRVRGLGLPEGTAATLLDELRGEGAT